MSSPPKWTWISGGIAFVAVLCLVVFLLADVIPPGNLTRTRITILKHQILLFVSEFHRLPADLAELPRPINSDNKTTDGWGNQIFYSYDTNGIVTLRSFGADDRPGGTGDAADIQISFPTKGDDGLWLTLPPRR
jgi:hypothetical protein